MALLFTQHWPPAFAGSHLSQLCLHLRSAVFRSSLGLSSPCAQSNTAWQSLSRGFQHELTGWLTVPDFAHTAHTGHLLSSWESVISDYPALSSGTT